MQSPELRMRESNGAMRGLLGTFSREKFSLESLLFEYERALLKVLVSKAHVPGRIRFLIVAR
jgi:hypothetical protein